MKEQCETMEPEHDQPADITIVLELARRMRVAFEHDGTWRLPGLARFPSGACGDAARLIAEYLRRHGHGDWTYIEGSTSYEHYRTHVWLRQGGIILDVTADQFGDGADPVIVTRDSTWHARWPHQRAHTSHVGLSRYAGDPRAHADYKRLAALLAAAAGPTG